MSTVHSRNEILDHLLRHRVATIGTFDEKRKNVRMRVMYFGVDSGFNIYLMCAQKCPKMEQMLTFPRMTLMVFGEEEPFDDSWEVEIEGVPEILETPYEMNYCLERLKDRNPFAEVTLEAGIRSQFTYIRVKPSLLRFSVYREALDKQTPTILQF